MIEFERTGWERIGRKRVERIGLKGGRLERIGLTLDWRERVERIWLERVRMGRIWRKVLIGHRWHIEYYEGQKR